MDVRIRAQLALEPSLSSDCIRDQFRVIAFWMVHKNNIVIQYEREKMKIDGFSLGLVEYG